MSRTKQNSHTPGPWDLYLQDGVAYIEEHGIPEETETIATVNGRPELEANARLIAAAPELLEACKAAVMHLGTRARTPAEIKMRDYLIDAIAKATGGAE